MIIRTPHKANYTMIANAALCDERLSWKARGLLAYLLSKPDNWRVMVAHLVKQGPDGRTSVMAGLEELEKVGYIRRTRRPTIGGRYDGYDTELYESPDETASGFSTSNHDRLSDTENRPLVITDLPTTDLTRKEAISEIVNMEEIRKRNDELFPERKLRRKT